MKNPTNPIIWGVKIGLIIFLACIYIIPIGVLLLSCSSKNDFGDVIISVEVSYEGEGKGV